jgi:hypothetical protein
MGLCLKISLDTLHRRPGFKASGFSFQVCSVFVKELQCMNVNFLWRCKECLHNSGDHFQHLLWCVCVLFVISWPVGLSAMSGVQMHSMWDYASSPCSSYPTGQKIFGRLSDDRPVFIHAHTIITSLLQTCTV